jgi:hypothetical protein
MHSLDAAIRKKGMGNLISLQDWEAKAKAKRWLEGTAPVGEFDPLVVAYLEINKKAFEMFNTHLRDECPLCAANRILKRNADKQWIDNISDLMYATCLANGLIKRANGHKIT